ncbi:cell wall hydrolase [Pararhizobium mangrovi]
MTTGSIPPTVKAEQNDSGATHVAAVNVGSREKQCLMRAMYFESNRSSDDGLLAVGSVVMNRVASPKFPNTICGVVGQPNQFAPGVLSRKMNPRTTPRVEKVADLVLSGKRHPKVGPAKFFHTAGLHFPYNNMHYVVVAGGNAFYEKRRVSSPASRAIDIATADVPASVPVPGARPVGGLDGSVLRTAFAEQTTVPLPSARAAFAAATE